MKSKMILKIYIFIGENNSKDNTLKILQNYKNKKVEKKITILL